MQERRFQQREKQQGEDKEQQDKNREQNNLVEFAEQLFQFWDEDKIGSIPLDVIVRDMLSIGLATG